MTVADAFAATLDDCIRHIHSNVEGSVRGKDPERLHQLRVGVRRALRRFEHKLGPARDWDVLISQVDQAIQENRRRGGEFGDLIDLAENRRARVHARLAKTLSNSPLPTLLRRAARLVGAGGARVAPDTPFQELAIRVLDARERQTRKMLRHIRSLKPKELHRLRICVKKLRYASEFFQATGLMASNRGLPSGPKANRGRTQRCSSCHRSALEPLQSYSPVLEIGHDSTKEG